MRCPKYVAREEAARAELVKRYNLRLFWAINALTAIQWICYWTGNFGVIH